MKTALKRLNGTNGWVTRHFGVVFLHARIDVAGDPQLCLDDPEPAD